MDLRCYTKYKQEGSVQAANSLAGGGTIDVLQAVAEQLKVPLTIIARQAELNQALGTVESSDLRAIHVQATTALTLVDCYLLGLSLAQGQTQLSLEPVSLSSVLTSTAHDLYYLARQNNVDLEVQVAGKYEPVMANQRGLKAALLSLGYGLIEAGGADQARRQKHLTLSAHRTPHGLVAGMYGEYEDLEAHEWRTALKLCGQASQPFTALCAGSGAGLFVADTILRSMTTQLRVGRRQKEAGLAATFRPSQQLVFV